MYMNPIQIAQKISSGMRLKVPVDITKLPVLIDDEFTNNGIIELDWTPVLHLIMAAHQWYATSRICAIAKHDLKDEKTGRVYKQGWESKGWDGDNYYYFAMVQ